MTRKFSAERVEGVASYKIPGEFAREVGRIVVRWAFFEYAVQQTVWDILDVDQAEGRIALREPRVVDRLEMLNELLAYRKGSWNAELYKDVLTRAKLLASKRDILAHGIWGEHGKGQWHVQLARGAWPKNLSDIVAGNKRVTPELVPISITDLRSTTDQIEKLIGDFRKLRESAVGPPRPSPRKSA